jgi:hypothetical protein
MRLKIIAGNLVAVLLLGLVSYVVVGQDLRTHLGKEVEGQLGNDQALLERSLRLTALEFVKLVKDRAATADVRGVFSALDEEGRRTRAFDAAERNAAWFGDPARGARGTPAIVLVTDDTGKVLARNADRNRMYGMRLDSALPAVRTAIKRGEASHDAWKKEDEGKLFEIAVAPVHGDEGQIVGALLVGYDYSNGFAQSEAKRLGNHDIAFIVDDKVYSSTFDEITAKQLRAFLFGDGANATKAALAGNVSERWATSWDGSEYVGITAPMPEAESAHVAYAVLVNRTRAAAYGTDATKIILVMMVICALIVLGYGFMIGNSIVRPIEEIEEGVLSIINGNTDLRLDTSNPDLGGLAYRINQLLNVFTGVSEADDEDDQGRVSNVSPGHWKDSEFSDAQGGGGGGASSSASTEPLDDPAVAASLSAEPEDAYYRRVFAEYVAAKKAAGETVNIPEERFTQRLKGNEQALVKKHNVRAVRFQVVKGGGLQPVLIR